MKRTEDFVSGPFQGALWILDQGASWGCAPITSAFTRLLRSWRNTRNGARRCRFRIVSMGSPSTELRTLLYRRDPESQSPIAFPKHSYVGSLQDCIWRSVRRPIGVRKKRRQDVREQAVWFLFQGDTSSRGVLSVWPTLEAWVAVATRIK